MPSRRAFLGAITLPSLLCGEKGRILADERRRYPDPATEFEVLRLTDPTFSSYLPAYHARAVSHRSNWLVYSSDRDGTMQAYRVDVKTGEGRQLTQAGALDRNSLTLTAGERAILYFDGPSLRQTSLSTLRDREVYRTSDGFEPAGGLCLSEDDLYATFVERRGPAYRLRLLRLARGGTATTVAESDQPLKAPQPRPRRAGILYQRAGDSWWLVNFDGHDNRRLRTAPGTCGPATWSPDGKTVFYLLFPEDRMKLNSLRENTPDTGADALIAPTSQFVHFGRNGDASVFVGASGSKASPHVLLLLRMTRREFTLAEHRASDPAMVAPIFSPMSQRVFFASDRHGKPAIYSMSVEKLVEETES